MIQSIHRALAVLELLAEGPERAVPLSEIARRLGLNLSTCANIMRTMLDLGYVEQARKKAGYCLGPAAYHLTRNGPYRKDLMQVALPLVAELAADVGETVLLAALTGGRRSILCQVDGNEVFRVSQQFLLRQDVYQTATGRLLLAHMPEGDLKAFLAANGLPSRDLWAEASTARKLHAELARLRDEGRAITVSDPVGVAFPIREDARVVAALGLFLPGARFTGDHRERILGQMAEAAGRIGAKLKELRRGAQ